MRFLCPNCHRELEVPDEAAGTAGACRLCGAAIIAPTGPGQPAVLAHAPGAPPPPSGMAPGPQAPFGRLQPFNILSEAWSLVWANFGPIAISYYVPAIALVMLMAVVVGPYMFSAMQEGMAGMPGKPPEMPLWVTLGSPLLTLLLSPLLAGVLYVTDDLLTKGEAEISAMFRGLQQYKDITLFTLVVYILPTTLVSLVFSYLFKPTPTSPPSPVLSVVMAVLPIFLYVTLLPGLMDIVDRGSDAMTALKSGWEFTKGHRWMILLTGIVLYLGSIAGIVACFVGVLVTSLMLPVGFVLMYRDIRGLRGTSGG
jgi:hypothetical protein